MRKIIVEGGTPLKGIVTASGAKNAVLPVIAASLLTDGECVIDDTPWLADVETLCKTVGEMGVKTDFAGGRLRIDTKGFNNPDVPSEYARKMRASSLLLGPVLARCGRAFLPLPGGCAIGARPLDLHVKGLEAMGAKIVQTDTHIEAFVGRLRGARIYLDFPSVGATENIMMAAALAEGQTVIENAASEPEIVDLATYLSEMGAKIKGAGTDTIRIEGVNELHSTHHAVIPDRIEIATFLAATAATGGSVIVDNVIEEHLKSVFSKLREAGAVIEENYGCVRVGLSDGGLHAIDVKTLPYPGFPTDMQAQIMAMLASAEGESTVTETIFENRFMHVRELCRMGADIRIDAKGTTAYVRGVPKLHGADVRATDLRAGGAMIIAALAAEGRTEISDIHHIERGYEDICEKFRSLGAKIYIKE